MFADVTDLAPPRVVIRSAIVALVRHITGRRLCQRVKEKIIARKVTRSGALQLLSKFLIAQTKAFRSVVAVS